MTASAQEEQTVIVPEGQPFFVLIQIHPMDVRGVVQGQHIGAVLVQLEKIAAALVEQGEVGGDHDLVRRDGPAGRHRLAGAELQHLGALKDPQIPSDGSEKSQRMELGLTGGPYRPCRREREGDLLHELRGRAQFVQGLQLPVQLLPIVQGVDEGVLLLKVTVDILAQSPVLLQRSLVGFQIEPGPVCAEPPDQLVIDQPVLRGDLRRGVPGDAAADAVRLHQGVVHPCLGQLPGAQNSSQPAADDEHIGLQV